MMWIQKQHFFEIRLLVQTYSSIYRSSIDMVLKVTSNLRFHKICIYVFHNFLYIVIVSVSINSILSIISKHILLIIFCNDDRDQML